MTLLLTAVKGLLAEIHSPGFCFRGKATQGIEPMCQIKKVKI